MDVKAGLSNNAPLIIGGVLVLAALWYFSSGAGRSPVAVGSQVVQPDTSGQTAIAAANLQSAAQWQQGLFGAFSTLAGADTQITQSQDQLSLGLAQVNAQENVQLSESNNQLTALLNQQQAQLEAVKNTNKSQTTSSFWNDLFGGIDAALPFLGL